MKPFPATAPQEKSHVRNWTRCGVVVHHRRGRGAARIADSYVTMRLGDFAALLSMILEGER